MSHVYPRSLWFFSFTDSCIIIGLKLIETSQVGWCAPVVPATWEAKAGGSFEARRSSPAWTTYWGPLKRQNKTKINRSNVFLPPQILLVCSLLFPLLTLSWSSPHHNLKSYHRKPEYKLGSLGALIKTEADSADLGWGPRFYTDSKLPGDVGVTVCGSLLLSCKVLEPLDGPFLRGCHSLRKKPKQGYWMLSP
jgi:hypothetical protein